MNNAPKVEAFNSYYKQAIDFQANGNIDEARELFLKAASIANEISVNSPSYNVRMEYHNLAVKILDHAKNNCVKKEVQSVGASDKEPEIKRPVSQKIKSKVTFDDVAGLDEVKDQIIYHVLEPMRNKELAKKFGIKPGGKILLYGPPGTGKTFIARAIAGEVNAEFYLVNCQDLISKFMGESSKQLVSVFEEARKNERAIIFFDEFDSVASRRGDSSGGTDGEIARFVATFLTLVDGFEQQDEDKMLLLIGATNRPWALDSAMLRGGRFDTQIYVGTPDKEAREFMVKRTIGDTPTDDDVDLNKLARDLEGYGGGDIVAICEKIRFESYMRICKMLRVKADSDLEIEEHITNDDIQAVLSKVKNNTSPEEIVKFIEYRYGNQ
ncbi:MAG: ATP-binding protein [Clostridia bacterium]|nr:ATP-binding protein [Clostridia bacterium]